MTVRPITPEDIKRNRGSAIARDLIEVINDFLSDKYESDHDVIRITLSEILGGMEKRGFKKSQVLQNLNFEDLYREKWWVVFKKDGLDGTSESCWFFNTIN